MQSDFNRCSLVLMHLICNKPYYILRVLQISMGKSYDGKKLTRKEERLARNPWRISKLTEDNGMKLMRS